jgi:SAM-dependent methyltransferase
MSWDSRFLAESGFKPSANQLLIDEVKHRAPGDALDLLMGQGRNALYLARRGWRVTGIDISEIGLRIAREAAAKERLAIETICADIARCDLGTDRWDLVAMLYAGDSEQLVERVKSALRPGGLFVLEYFHADTGAGWRTGQLAGLFGSEFELVRDEVVEDVADWTLRTQKLVRFVSRRQPAAGRR